MLKYSQEETSDSHTTTDILLPRRSAKFHSRIALAIFLLLIWVLGVCLVLTNLQNIRDQVVAMQNPLASNIATLADDAGLNSHGKFLLQVSRAQLDDRQSFNRNCPIKENQAILLGCYASQRIYVFDVNDERISGITSVIAAHEMLHAAYQRLSLGERAKVDEMLKEELSHIDNQEILDIMKVYEQTESGQEFNELHSLLATEEPELSPQLENYYEKYFSDRSKVIAAYQKYQKVFDDLNVRAKTLQNELTDKKTQIQANEAKYQSDAGVLSGDIQQFNSCANTPNCFASQAEFERQRAALLSRQQTLSDLQTTINTQIEEYNSDVNELNALGIEAQKLNQSLDSKAPEID